MWALYNTSTGVINAVLGGSEPHINDVGAGEDYVAAATDITQETHYVLAGVVTERPVFPMTLGDLTITTAESSITPDIPVGTVVTHPNGSDTIPNDTLNVLTFSSAIPGTYSVTFELFPYQTLTIEIEVTAA